MTESLEIGEMLRAAMRERYGEPDLPGRYQAFDTICSATQDRQDAVVALLREKPVDLMIVIGGYNSSNTANLARICAASRPTFHIADPDCLISAREIRHRPVGSKVEVAVADWLPAARASLDRADVRGVDPGQPGRRSDREADGIQWIARRGPVQGARVQGAPLDEAASN